MVKQLFGRGKKNELASEVLLGMISKEIGEMTSADEFDLDNLEKSLSAVERLQVIERLGVADRKEMTRILAQGGVGLTAILLVLHYEKTDVIASKAFNLATRMIGR